MTAKAYAAIIAAVLVTGSLAWGWIESSRLDAVKAEYAQFVAGAKALGDLAKKDAEQQDAANKQNKELTDANTTLRLAASRRDIDELRDKHPPSGFVPKAPAASPRPDLICFDRTEYIRTDGEFTTASRKLADRCTETTIDLNAAREWASRLPVDNDRR